MTLLEMDTVDQLRDTKVSGGILQFLYWSSTRWEVDLVSAWYFYSLLFSSEERSPISDMRILIFGKAVTRRMNLHSFFATEAFYSIYPSEQLPRSPKLRHPMFVVRSNARTDQ